MLSLCVCAVAEEEQRTLLEALQQHIFWFSAELASDSEQPSPGKRYISSEEIALLEQTIDREMARVPALHQFVLPGRCEAASRLHLARTVARRAERRLVELGAEVTIRQMLLRYLNRLSDCLYATGAQRDHAAHQRRLVTEIAARYLAASGSPAPDAPKAQAGSLSFHELHQLIRQAIEHARQLQVPVVVSIVDAHGTENRDRRMPDALLVSSELAPKKPDRRRHENRHPRARDDRTARRCAVRSGEPSAGQSRHLWRRISAVARWPANSRPRH